jgi:hypothetical protein
MSFIQISDRNLKQYQPNLFNLDSLAEYPLGEDYFRISHGEDYLAFFRRLGKVKYFAWSKNEQPAAVLAAILRKLPKANQKKFTRAWYLCDLKVHPDYRGQNLPLRLATRAFFSTYLKCRRFYAISMNPSESSQNRVAKLAGHFSWATLRPVETLALWSFDQKTMTQVKPLLETHRGMVTFHALSGVKDIILKSSGAPLPLYHAQFGPFAEHGISHPMPDSVHMFCTPFRDSLTHELVQSGFKPSATATILAHRMSNENWNWILTSDI